MKGTLKKMLATGLAAFMAFSVTACGDSGASSSTSGAASSGDVSATQDSETIEITGFAMEGPYTKGDFNDLPIWDYAEEATGVRVNFETAPQASFQEKLNLKFASNQLPDVFFKCTLESADITKYSSEGTLVPLDDYLEEYAPNFSTFMEDDTSIEKEIRLADGKIYGFPYLVTAAPSRIFPKLFINQKWMEAQNLEMPETTDDFYEMLKTMSGYDYNGNGTKDEIPFCTEGVNGLTKGLMGSFGLLTRGAAQEEWDIDPETGELRFVKTTDEYKAFLEFCNKLYEEKLLDQEVFTVDIPKLTAKAEQNILGVVFTNNTNYLGSYAEDYTYIPAPLIGPDGDQLFGGRTIPVAGQNTFITKVNEHPAETVKWVDYFYSPEGIEHFFMGVEDDTYTIDDEGNPQFTDKVMNNPDGMNMEEVLGSYVCWSGGGNPSVADDAHFGNFMIPETTVNAAQALIDYTPEIVWGQLNYSAEDATRISVLTTDISTYLTDMTAKFITGEASFDQWEDYKANVEKMGLEEYREIVQKTIDNAGME